MLVTGLEGTVSDRKMLHCSQLCLLIPNSTRSLPALCSTCRGTCPWFATPHPLRTWSILLTFHLENLVYPVSEGVLSLWTPGWDQSGLCPIVSAPAFVLTLPCVKSDSMADTWFLTTPAPLPSHGPWTVLTIDMGHMDTMPC
jgi:hypothetical protein